MTGGCGLGLVCHWSSEWTAVVGLWTFWFSPSIFEYSLLCSGHWILGVIHWKTFWPLTLCGPFDNTTIAHTLIKGGKFVTLHKSRAFIELPFSKVLTNIWMTTWPEISVSFYSCLLKSSTIVLRNIFKANFESKHWFQSQKMNYLCH